MEGVRHRTARGVPCAEALWINALVIDDDVAERGALERLLRSLEVNAHGARSVLEAQLMLVRPAFPIDALFIDERVRHSDIRSFCDALRHHPVWSLIPIVVVATGGPRSLVADPALARADVLARPLDRSSCAATVARLRAGAMRFAES